MTKGRALQGLERDFQANFIKRLKKLFPGLIVLKNDSRYLQGFPDLTLLYKDKWAVLEVKASERAGHQPNQDYYISQLSEMSFAAFVYPENEEEILSGLQATFQSG